MGGFETELVSKRVGFRILVCLECCTAYRKGKEKKNADFAEGKRKGKVSSRNRWLPSGLLLIK